MTMIYFLQLIKKNTLLYSILLNGNLSNLDLNHKEVNVWSEKAIELKNLRLGVDTFESVMIVVYDSFIAVDFKTSDGKFFNNTKFFFGKDVPVRLKRPYSINNEKVEEEFKDLGSFEDCGFDGPISITLRHFNVFKYSQSFRFYTKKIEYRQLSRKLYYLKGEEVPEEVLFLFKPGEVALKPTFTPDSYSPIIEIEVKDNKHPVVRYFESRGSIFHEGKRYKHGKVPKIKPHETRKLEFVEHWDEGNSSIPVLVVNTVESSNYSGEAIYVSYDVLSPEINFFKIGDQILMLEQLESEAINIEEYRFVKAVFGKEAVDEFGDPAYSQGIGIYELK